MDCAESQLCTPYWASPGTNICSEADPAGIYTLILRDLGSAIAWQYAIIEVDNEGTVTRARTDVGRPQLDFCFGYVDCNGPSDRCWPVSVSGRITTTGTGGLRARFSWPRTEFGQEVIEAGTVDLQGTDLRAQGVALQYATRRGDCDLNYYSFSRNHEWELFRCECPDPNQVCVPDFGRAQDGTIELRPIRTTCVGLPE